jgi:hypothetical protein
MSFAALLRPRKQVLSEEGIEGIIDVANVGDPRGRKLESRPQSFLDLTYPTADVRRVIQSLDERFSKPGSAPGLFLFEGLKGSGKSHLLLLAYHLFKNPKESQKWLKQHKLKCNLPSNADVILTKFTDRPLISIWDFIYERLTGNYRGANSLQPGLEEMQSILGSRRLVLILDELEQGIKIISDSAARHQNIAFLQMLSEWANRSDQVTLFTSIYSDQGEPGSTLKRVPAVRVQFAHAADRARVVSHRLFENYLDFNPDSASAVVDSYLNVWRRHLPSFDADEYRSQMLQAYPFSPDLLDLILKRVPLRGGFQNVRGALGFLANMVRLTHTTVDLITPAHASLQDRETIYRLGDLDVSGELVARGKGNLDDLQKFALVLAPDIAATVLLYTLTGVGNTIGATREDLIRSVMTPSADINEFERTLLAFTKYASNFHPGEDRFYFDLEENADSKVELHSLRFADAAIGELRKIWLDDVFREYNAVILQDVDETKTRVEALEKDRLRYVLAPRRLKPEERHALYFGLILRNQVILLEPRDPNFNLDAHPDLKKWASRKLAARQLVNLSDAKRKADYERIASADQSEVVTAIKRAGLVYIRFDKYGVNAGADQIEEESLGNVASAQDVKDSLLKQVYPPQLITEHLAEHLPQFKNRPIKEVDHAYRSELGFPVPVMLNSVTRAIRDLCRDSKIGIRHGARGNFCGEDPNLTESELATAILDDPFPVTTPPPRVQPPGQRTTPIQPPQPTDTLVVQAPVPPTTIAPIEDVPILSQTSPGALRQAVAARLQSYREPRIIEARFTVYLDDQVGDLSSLPATLRGSLSGAGQLSAEINITREGEFNKADVEQMAERLPSLPRAEYSARLRVRLAESNGGANG